MGKRVLNTANGISLARIGLLPLLWYLFSVNNVLWTIIVFILVGLSDAVDGFIARKLGQISEFGATLDSVADYAYYTTIAVWMVTEFYAYLAGYFIFVFIPLCFALASYVILGLRFRRLVFLHLYTSKATAISVYLFVIATLASGFDDRFFLLVLSLWTVSALEMIIVSLFVDDAVSNVGSVFLLK